MSEKIVKVEKTYNVPAEVLFKAIADAKLFFNCGADEQKSKNDFRVGGKYFIDFGTHGTTVGEYIEISKYNRIVFTWQAGDRPNPCSPTHPTTVTIDIEPRGEKSCHLKLVHTGFKTQEQVDAHSEGWTAGTDGLHEDLHS